MRIRCILAAYPDDVLSKNDPFMPLSFAILAGLAPDHDYLVTDLLWDRHDINYAENVDLVAISTRASAVQYAYEIALKYKKKGKTVVMGGPQVSVTPHEAIKYCDSVVVGEVEDLWKVLLNDLESNQLKSFYVCSPADFDSKGLSVYKVSHYPDLNKIPLPDRSIFKRKYVFDTVYAMRGCPINCDFCVVSELFGKKNRSRNIDDVIKEISTFKGFYYLLDDTVFGRINTYDYYLELYDKLYNTGNKKLWTGQGNIDAVFSEKGREVIKAAARSGLTYIALGLESINDEVLRNSGAINKMGRNGNTDVKKQMVEAVEYLQSLGIIVSGWFAIGYENDSIDTYYQTLEFCMENNIIPVFTPIHALPGSKLYQRMVAEDKLLDEHWFIPNDKMPFDQVVNALEHTLEKGYSRNARKLRSRHYSKKFWGIKPKSIQELITKRVFVSVLQKKMSKILESENIKLRKVFSLPEK